MKINKIYITAGLTALVAFTSCKKLDLFPTNALVINQSFQSVKDAQNYDIGIYSYFRGRNYGAYMFYSDVQADQLNATLDYGNRNGAPSRWDGTFTADDQGFAPIWAGYYAALANVNTAIAGYPAIVPNPSVPLESIQLKAYKADAFLARAFYYHKLIQRWGKSYNPATAASDLGVPLVLTYDLNGKPARATVKAVYDQIIADITAAEGLYASVIATPTPTTLSTTDQNTFNAFKTSVAGAPGSILFTADVALALEARVRLSLQDWNGAYTAANTLISSGRYPLINTAAAYKAYWATDGNSESIMQVAVNTTTEFPPVNNIYLGFRPADGKYDPDFVPTATAVNYYPAGDIRKAAYLAQLPVIVQGVNYATTPAASAIWLVNKYPGNPALFTTASTNYAHAPKIVRIAEMYCIAAEAGTNGSNAAGGLIALNNLRAARGVAADANTGALLAQDIKDERTRELAFEGFRLDDLERWGLGFTRGTPQNVALLIQGPAATTLTVAASNPKYVWGVPSNDVLINTNIVQNPGW